MVCCAVPKERTSVYVCVLPGETVSGHEESQCHYIMAKLTFEVNPKYDSQVPNV